MSIRVLKYLTKILFLVSAFSLFIYESFLITVSQQRYILFIALIFCLVSFLTNTLYLGCYIGKLNRPEILITSLIIIFSFFCSLFLLGSRMEILMGYIFEVFVFGTLYLFLVSFIFYHFYWAVRSFRSGKLSLTNDFLKKESKWKILISIGWILILSTYIGFPLYLLWNPIFLLGQVSYIIENKSGEKLYITPFALYDADKRIDRLPLTFYFLKGSKFIPIKPNEKIKIYYYFEDKELKYLLILNSSGKRKILEVKYAHKGKCVIPQLNSLKDADSYFLKKAKFDFLFSSISTLFLLSLLYLNIKLLFLLRYNKASIPTLGIVHMFSPVGSFIVIYYLFREILFSLKF